ncbi:hypothetical protein D0868_03715 [Hortaea werneckii]|uniref:Uncharacterized protein n=1 Tax=Hortaea werneckii TaxID=91943 RepID=A0A3M6Z591_HORWE|nr:hypothetical protein D0868_03715 [Hortaea werneckii]
MVGKTIDAKAGVREMTEARIEGRTRTEQMKTREEGRGIGMARSDGGVDHHIHIIATTIEGTNILGRHGASDSDSLDEVIGPEPPSTVIPRGRGATAGSSAIDQRFRPDYDPRADIQNSPSPERGPEGLRDDWDLALEALRDRAKWKAQGGDRLKAAGFTDEEVDRWKDGGREKDERDVRWRKRGEGREWDRGKTIEGEHVEVKASWARRGKS